MGKILSRTFGTSRRQWMARAAIWAGVVMCGLFVTTSAWAGSAPKDGGHGLFADNPYLALGLPEPGKADLFKKPTLGNPNDEITCLALNIYFEARGEPEKGKRAVGHVVMNRVANKRFPGTVCDVIRQGGELRRHRCQFSWWCDGRSDMPRNKRQWQKSNEHALAVYWGRSDDPTAGALWYHADYVNPSWNKTFVRGPKIGRHIFYSAPTTTASLMTDIFSDSFLAN